MEENTNATNNEALEAENVDSQDANAGNDNKIDEILERLAKAEAKVAQAETENEKLKACQ